jgi:hypothetical protein
MRHILKADGGATSKKSSIIVLADYFTAQAKFHHRYCLKFELAPIFIYIFGSYSRRCHQQ